MKKHVLIVAAWAISIIVVSGTTAQAVLMITGKNIKNNTVGSVDLKNLNVKGADLANGSVGYSKLATVVSQDLFYSGTEVEAAGGVNVDGTAAPAVDPDRSYNQFSGTAATAAAAANLYTITIPGFSTDNTYTHWNPLVTIDTADNSAMFAVVKVISTGIEVRTFLHDGSATPLPNGSKIFFAIV